MDTKFAKALLEERKKILEILRSTPITSNHKDFMHAQIISKATYAPWINDTAFQSVYQNIKENTLVDEYRCFIIWDVVHQLRKIEGDLIEVGVWKGGTSALISCCNKGAKGKMFLADTFSGVVKPSEKDTLYRGGEHADTSIEVVEKLFYDLGISLSEEQILKGVFPEDTGYRLPKKIKFVHIDVDTYQSAKDAFNFLERLMVPGGVMVFDDYGIWGCEGITLFLNEVKNSDKRFHMMYNLSGQCLLTF